MVGFLWEGSEEGPGKGFRWDILWWVWYEFLDGRILEAYRTGHGRLTVRGKAQIEQLDQRTNRSAVIITEVCLMFVLHIHLCGSSSQRFLSEFWARKRWWDRILTVCANAQIPYQANKAALVEKIAELVNNKVEFIQQHLCFVMCAFCFPNLTKKLCLSLC